MILGSIFYFWPGLIFCFKSVSEKPERYLKSREVFKSPKRQKYTKRRKSSSRKLRWAIYYTLNRMFFEDPFCTK